MRVALPLILVAAACGPDPLRSNAGRQLTLADGEVGLTVDGSTVIAEVSPQYLSFAIDSSQVVGGNWWSPSGQSPTTPFDFTQPNLLRLTQPLAPALLRIGGTAADQIYYDFNDPPLSSPPLFYNYLLTPQEFDQANQFAEAAGLGVLFTLNAGTGPRLPDLLTGEGWTPNQAQTLVDYAVAQGYPVVAWELGNEINAYPLEIHLVGVSGSLYASDLATAQQLLASDAPGTLLGGPSSAFWPEWGELNPILPSFLAADAQAGGQLADLITFHYYPQEGSRCPIAVVPASPTALFQPGALDQVSTWAQQVVGLQQQNAPNAKVWLTETGNAQCGGQAGTSDTFASSFWWLDQLGLLAREGVSLQVHQTLVGADYGMLDDQLNPRPDYWASLLWKQLMGTKVLDLEVANTPTVRAYAHCAADGSSAVSVLALNLSQSDPATVEVGGIGGTQVDQYLVTAASLGAQQVNLNGQPLTDPGVGPPTTPPLPQVEAQPTVTLPPLSYAFLEIHDAQAAACP